MNTEAQMNAGCGLLPLVRLSVDAEYFTHSTHSLHLLILLILVAQAGESQLENARPVE